MFAFVTIALFGALAQDPAPGGATARPQPTYELSLHENALVRGLEVTIGDLVDLAPTDAESMTIASLRFAAAPTPGFLRTVTRSELLQSLVASGYAAGTFRIRGATEVAVQSLVAAVSQVELIEHATTVLEAVLQKEGGDVEYELASPVRAHQVQPGRRSQEMRARIRGGATNPNTAVVEVEILVDEVVGGGGLGLQDLDDVGHGASVPARREGGYCPAKTDRSVRGTVCRQRPQCSGRPTRRGSSRTSSSTRPARVRSW